MNTPLPVIFLSHGSPMHALEASAAANAWAKSVERLMPRAILIASAHWESGMPLLGGSPEPRTIHDFGGFPEALYRIQYPAKGSPELARRAQALLAAADIRAGIDGTRGLDHGAWVPLRHMYPDAKIPVVQLSVQSQLDASHHVGVGRALQSLRDEGVLIIGSGHMTHNLRDYMTAIRSGQTFDYAAEFSEWVHERVMARHLDELVQWEAAAPFAQRAHPTPEHFLPLFVALGAAGEGYTAERLVAGVEGGALAMDAYCFH